VPDMPDTTILESSRTATIDVLVRKDMVVNEHKRNIQYYKLI
jgi:hypothetical protein